MPRSILNSISTRSVFALAICGLALLSACSGEQSSTETDMQAFVETTETEADAVFASDITVRTLMTEIVEPNALALWRAVRYVATEEGVQEDVAPQSDAEWDALRTSANLLIAAGNALLLTERQMDGMESDDDTPDYQYTSLEIQSLVALDPERWREYVQQLQFFTEATLETIENRDVLGLIETGAAINNACQGCHGDYWYRPLN